MKLILNNIEFDLIRRRVKNLRIQLAPPDGSVTVIAPLNLSRIVIDDFVNSKFSWIQKHQQRFKDYKPANTYQYVSGETHYLWGRPFALQIVDYGGKPYAEIIDNKILSLLLNSDLDLNKRMSLLDKFYRAELSLALDKLVAKWQAIINVKASSFYIRKMKTKWGSCNVISKRIAFNLELAKKPIDCLEYVVVHELVHLLEPSHNSRFKGLMDKFLPDWRNLKKSLNSY